MKFPEFTDDLSIVSKLGDNPGADNGLTAEGLKAKFDEGPLALQKFINSVLIAKLNEIFVAGGQLNDGLIMTGPINMNLNMLFGLADPKNDSEAVSYGFAKNNYVPKSRTVNGKSLSADISLSAEDVKAAPSGYGLGTGGIYPADLGFVDGNVARGGFFRWDTNPGDFPFTYGSMVIVPRTGDSAASQLAFGHGGNNKGIMALRTYSATTANEWHFLNPPLIVGTEYRTTERYNAKTVWVVLADLGTCPVGETIVNTSFTATGIVRWDGNDCIYESARNDKYLRTKRVSIISGKLAITNIFGTQVGSSHEYCRIWYTKD